ncbi:unnamed protein product [Durusdinium trenchii]|uniref:Uncharacterized protein n=1 Tax=Durusdinium trenchii TaxID=1381693 RepID=A0ABP0NF38_9DINO
MALIGDFKKQVNSLVAQKASAKKVLASTIGAAQGFQSILPSLDGGGRGLGARAASETPRPNEEVTLPALNLTQSQASETTPSLDQTVSEMGFAASSQPAVTSQPRWKQLAQKAKEDMAATQPALGVENTGDTKRLANHARRAINALAARPTVEPELEENIETFAKLLVETFGSLTAAFEEFDHHGREEITRAQWDAALNARGWDTQEICGIAASKLFSLVSRASKKPIGALTLPAWKSFFKKYLNRTAAHLLEEDRVEIDGSTKEVLEHLKAPKLEVPKEDAKASSDGMFYFQRRNCVITQPLPDALPGDGLHERNAGSKDGDDGTSDEEDAGRRAPHLDADAQRRLLRRDEDHEDQDEDAKRRRAAAAGDSAEAARQNEATDSTVDPGFAPSGPGFGRAPTPDPGEGDEGLKGLRKARRGGLHGDTGQEDAAKANGADEKEKSRPSGSRAPEVRAQMPTRPRAAGALRAVGPMQREALVLGRWAEAPRRQVALARRLLRLQVGVPATPVPGRGTAVVPAPAAISALGVPVGPAISALGVPAEMTGHVGQRMGLLRTVKRVRRPTEGPPRLGEAGHEEPKDSAVDEGLPDDAKVETTVAVTSIGLQTTSQGIQADSDLEEEVSIEETPGPPGDFQSLVKQVFRLYASGYSKGRFVFIRNPDLSRFMEDSKHILPGFRKRFRRFKRIFESLFDDTIQLQCDMPGQGLRITAGLTLDWFQVFVQKVVRRIGMEVMSFFAALLESQLY